MKVRLKVSLNLKQEVCLSDRKGILEILECSQRNLKQDLLSGADTDFKVRWEGLAQATGALMGVKEKEGICQG